MFSQDTIAAISSAVGPAARMIVRLSGREALGIAQSLSVDRRGMESSAACTFLSFSDLRCPCWIYTFLAPHSFTGEDLVEFHLPGGVVLAKSLLDELFRRGARLAEAGEFTARAYFAGKMDLAEAEGVAATIAAGNESALQAARQLMGGELARRLEPTMELIAQTLALVEVGIDFSEEDVTVLPSDELRRRCEQADGDIAAPLEETDRFEQLSHEPRIVMVGRPNAGKSTLINELIGRQRAVVSEMAGTTRDALTAELELAHGRVQLIDIAGMEQCDAEQNQIDELMQQHAKRAIESADWILLVLDVTDERAPLDLPRPVDLTVLSKFDLPRASSLVNSRQISVSAKSGAGMMELREALDRLAFGRESGGARLALNRRHIAALDERRAAIGRGAACIVNGGAEIIALELREALDALGRVLGTVTADDVLGRVFSAFCIGK